MVSRYTKIEFDVGDEDLPVEADFRQAAKKLNKNLVSASWTALTSGVITLDNPQVSSNKATIDVTAVAKGCTLLQAIGDFGDGVKKEQKCKIVVHDDKTCC
jgi:hypothetical protein